MTFTLLFEADFWRSGLINMYARPVAVFQSHHLSGAYRRKVGP